MVGQVKHGKTETAEYRIWCVMKSRCFNPNFHKYPKYGGRGITICERWLGPHGFENFLADMGERPSAEHSIDRLDNNGNYEPGNCRWATPKQQGRNRSVTRMVEYQGRMVPVGELAEIAGISYYAMHKRLSAGLTPEQAVSTPPRYKKSKSVP